MDNISKSPDGYSICVDGCVLVKWLWIGRTINCHLCGKTEIHNNSAAYFTDRFNLYLKAYCMECYRKMSLLVGLAFESK